MWERWWLACSRSCSISQARPWKACGGASEARPKQSQGKARGAASRDQGRIPHARYLHHQAVRHGLAGLARAQPVTVAEYLGAGREVDLSEDRRDEAEGLQGH